MAIWSHSPIAAGVWPCGVRALLPPRFLLWPNRAPLTGTAAFGDWRADRPGLVRLIRPVDLPKPGATASSANVSHVAPRPASAMPQVPPGFKVELFAEGLSGPREMRTAPNGDIFVAETRAGRIRVLRLSEDGSKPVKNEIYASGLNQPFGIAFFPSEHPQWVYVANTDSVVRFRYQDGDLKAADKPETVVAELPRGGHSTRDIVFTQRRQADAGVGRLGQQRRGRKQRQPFRRFETRARRKLRL